MNETKDEIQQYYLAQHDALGSREEAEDKELFNQQHRQVWADCDTKLEARKLDLESQTLLTDADKVELKELGRMSPAPSSPARDLAKEIDELKVEIKGLKEIK